MDELPTPRFLLEGSELLEHIAERAAHNAKAELIAREERRNRTLTTVIAVLGLVGVGAVMGGLKLLVNQEMKEIERDVRDGERSYTLMLDRKIEEITAQITKSVREQVRQEVLAEVTKQLGEQIGDVQKQLALNSQFEEYVELSDRLVEQLSGVHRGKDKFVSAVLGETMAVVRAVAAQPSLVSRTRFVVVTRRIVDVLVRFNRVGEIDELDRLLGDALQRDAELAKSLVDHYGQLVIGSPLAIAEQGDHVARLERYATAVGQTVDAHKQLVWQLFLEFKRNGFARNATTDGLLESSQDLPAESREQFWFDLCLYSDASLWMLTPDQQGREMERLMAALVERYPIVAKMIERTVEANPSLQQNIAERRMRTRSIMASHGQAAPPEEPSTPPQETASGSNALRR